MEPHYQVAFRGNCWRFCLFAERIKQFFRYVYLFFSVLVMKDSVLGSKLLNNQSRTSVSIFNFLCLRMEHHIFLMFYPLLMVGHFSSETISTLLNPYLNKAWHKMYVWCVSVCVWIYTYIHIPFILHYNCLDLYLIFFSSSMKNSLKNDLHSHSTQWIITSNTNVNESWTKEAEI